MARFNIQIEDDGITIGTSYSRERVKLSELDAFIAAVKAAAAFSVANADLPMEPAQDPPAESEAAE